ncbi:MAG: GTPase ObgE [SAR202 cluster bacterium]|nr:GTPase ObgE [SAR202 cluster bacterium]
MLDTKTLAVAGGKGGDGSAHLHREAFRPHGGPDGGDGGDGGDVIVVARASLRTLAHLTRIMRIVADDGEDGRRNEMTGKSADDRLVEVPVGTVVWDVTDGGRKQLLADLVADGSAMVAARGGKGGLGNVHFATPTNQTPMLAESAERGEERTLLLEVKLLADVAIVGAPNAGKSTLLAAVTRAQPKIADYPFTTLEPNLGVAQRHNRAIVLLDVPGLIEGAHVGKGLGLEFLRHVERVRAIVHLIDGLEEDLGAAYQRIEHELGEYPGGLVEKPRVVAVNKMDIPEARERFKAQQAALKRCSKTEPLAISAATHEGLDALLDAIAALVPVEQPAPQPVLTTPTDETARPEPRRRPRVEITRDKDVFVVHCKPAERLTGVANLNLWQARMQLHRELDRLGVLRALKSAGVERGDTVRIGPIELEWS